MPSLEDKDPPPLRAEYQQPLHLPPAYSAVTTSTTTTAGTSPSILSTTTSPPPAATAFATPLPPLSLKNDIDVKLPPLSSLTGGQTLPIRGDMAQTMAHPLPSQWSMMDRMRPSIDGDILSRHSINSPGRMDIDSASPDSRGQDRAGSVNLDDPDVRLAAEALGDLKADFISSPPSQASAIPSPTASNAHIPSSRSRQEAEPLFALLTTSHPFLANTIEGASSAYGGAKNFSPRFKSGAEYVEGYLGPIANTVGSVGRVTGVEGSVRWFLGRRQGSDMGSESSKKRRKVSSPGTSEPITKKRIEEEGIIASSQVPTEMGNMQDFFPPTPKGDRRLSRASTIDTLPAYDDMRSPAYTETMENPASAESSRPNQAWQSRLIMSTSGLSVAMSDESLRSLKYCLKWLRWANEHIGGVIGTLKTTVEQYEKPEDKEMSEIESLQRDAAALEASTNAEGAQKPSRDELVSRINSLKSDVVKTLQDAVNMVSRYTGGALPENAKVLVRRHLTSLPQRFRLALMTENEGAPVTAQSSDSAVRESAQKVLLLAKEGLDMVSQVSGIVDGTIVSAEEWCERMGRKRRNSRSEEAEPTLPQTEPNGDVKMG